MDDFSDAKIKMIDKPTLDLCGFVILSFLIVCRFEYV